MVSHPLMASMYTLLIRVSAAINADGNLASESALKTQVSSEWQRR